VALVAPALAIVIAFFALPAVRLIATGASGPLGWRAYAAVLVQPRYATSLVETIVISAATTLAALALAGTLAVIVARARFPGRAALIAALTLPLAFPGVVVGFLVIAMGGRIGIVNAISSALGGPRIVFAYSLVGLFVGYLYFSLPRVFLTMLGAAEQLDASLEDAARSLGARPWQVVRDVLLPGLQPALIAAGAICFATAMGAFGTAFTLATRLDVLPMVIYTAFTLDADIATAATLSVVLGVVTWATLLLARNATGAETAAAG